jgi:uncharacterized protein YndB with AHSA1/START domain
MFGDTPAVPRILGSLRSADGTAVVHMEDRLDTDVDDLWSALTDPRRLLCWLGKVEGELRLGGEFQKYFFASGSEGTGRVEVCEPPHRFVVVTKGSEEPFEITAEVTLTPAGAETILVVEERGMPVELLWAYGAGIQIHVEDLADHIAGLERREDEARWDELIPAYRALAAEIGH